MYWAYTALDAGSSLALEEPLPNTCPNAQANCTADPVSCGDFW